MTKKIRSLFLFLGILFFPIFVHADDNDIRLYLFHGDGCPHCAEELKFLDTIQDNYPNLEIVKYEVWYNDENAELLKKVEDAFDIKKVEFLLQ